MKLWSLMYPSIAGRILVVKALVISLAYYLMTVNGIPRNTLSDMEKNVRSFIWSGRKGQMAWSRAILPLTEGGSGASSVKLRYKAIKVGWLKRWWRPKPDRPEWAWVANDLLDRCAIKRHKEEEPSAREWITQSWQINSRSESLPKSLKEMVKTVRKYNATISNMRILMDQRLDMLAFHHPFAKNKHLQYNSKIMKCIQCEHGARTVRDLLQITTDDGRRNVEGCPPRVPGVKSCSEKAAEPISRIRDTWNPNQETPQRHDLWHTPRRLRRNKKADPLTSLVLFNPDTRSKHCLLGTIRIFGRFSGHKSGPRDPFQPDRSPARIDTRTAPSGTQVTISTDGSAVHNGWENTTAGVGVWYADRCRRNISMSLTNHGAELGAILEALRQNECNDLEIEPDSLTSLKAICSDAEKYEDRNWLDVQNADLLKSILIKLRTRPARTAFKWVKGHDDNYGNNEADKLANEGRESEETLRLDDE